MLLGGVLAQPSPTGPAAPPAVKEVQLAADAFVRNAPLPSWALTLADIPTTARTDPVVFRLAETQFRANGNPGYLVHRGIQVNNNTSLASIGQYVIPFVPQYQRVSLHVLRILRGTETLDRMSGVQVRFLERESGLESGIYSGTVTAALLLEDVRVGDTLQIVYSVSGQNPVFGTMFSDSASWDQSEPTELRRLSVLTTPERRMYWRMFGDHRTSQVRPTEFMQGDARVLRFEERGIDGLTFETQTPNDFIAARFIQFTEYADWAGVARWATTLFPGDSQLPAPMQPVIEQIRALPDAAQRTAAALRWVQQEIRYFSVSLGESSHRPYTPTQVVDRRYGDCKDKTQLLVTMLRELGIQATPVLVSLQNPNMPARLLPSPDLFDHVVAQVSIDGGIYYLDATRLGQSGPLGRMGLSLEGARGLAVRADTRELLTLSNPLASDLASTEVREVFTLPALDGDAQLEVRRVWHGNMAEYLRVAYARLNAEQRRLQATSDLERRYPGISLQGEPKVSDDAAANSFALEMVYKVPQPAKEFSGDWALRFFPSNLQGAFSLPKALQRNFPALVANLPYKAQYQLVVNWPDNVSLIQDPSTQRVESNFYRAQVQRSARGNVSNLNLQYATTADRVSPKDLSALVQDIQKLERALGGVMVVDRRSIKNTGLFSFNKPTLQQNMKNRLDAELRRLSSTLDEKRLQGDDLAEALCSRAETLADLGRASEGLKDAQEATRTAPALGRAWQCRGNVLFALGEFDRAVPDYTKALGLGHEAFSTFYRRGHSRFYAGQFEPAALDFAKAAEHSQRSEESDSVYARLWQVWALQRAGKAVPIELVQFARKNVGGAWPRPALAMVVGELAPEQLLADVDRKQGDDRELTLAEAWFYVGQFHRSQGDLAKAKPAFEKTRGQGITMYLEHVAAAFELATLK